MLRIADEEAERLKELIDDALDIARLDSDQMTIEMETSDLENAVREVVASMNLRTSDHRVHVETKGSLPPVRVDRRLVKLAIKQLLDNAVKYSAATSPVTVRFLREDGKVVIEVTDHGKGISIQEQHRIFDRFYRSPSVAANVPGSGLGLSIAYRIAEAHGGDLTVRSRPGETTFCLALPIEKKEMA
jgi:signal transduction histidine kinase